MKSLSIAAIVAALGGVGVVAWLTNPFATAQSNSPQLKSIEPIKTPLRDVPSPVFAQLPPAKAAAPGEQPEAKPEPLPDVPVADPKSKLTALNKEKTLYIEKTPAGESRVLFTSEVCLREGLLEVFLCKKNTKEHEAILRTDIDARFLHAALVAAGTTVGKPVQFLNSKTGEPEYKPASGQKVRVLLHYTLNGKLQTHPAQEWIFDKKTKKPMAHDWVFAGGRFIKNPDRPNDPDYYSANNGEVICISNFVDSMLDLPVEVSREAADLQFDALPLKIPPLKSQVWVILEPMAEKKK